MTNEANAGNESPEEIGRQELEKLSREINTKYNPGFWDRIKSAYHDLINTNKGETETKSDTKMENKTNAENEQPIEPGKKTKPADPIKWIGQKIRNMTPMEFVCYAGIAAAAIYGGVDVYQTAGEKKHEQKTAVCRTIDEKVSCPAHQPVKDRTLVVPDLQQRLQAAQKAAPNAAAKPVYENRGLAMKTNSDFDTGKPIEYSKLEELGMSYQGKEKIKSLKGPFMVTPKSKIPVYGEVNCMAVLENGQEICYGMNFKDFKELKDAYKGEYGALK